jgi:hypothetical protein
LWIRCNAPLKDGGSDRFAELVNPEEFPF